MVDVKVNKNTKLFSLKRGDVTIGATHIPMRMKPVLHVTKGNKMCIYGSFHNESCALAFMQELEKFINNGGKEE